MAYPDGTTVVRVYFPSDLGSDPNAVLGDPDPGSPPMYGVVSESMVSNPSTRYPGVSGDTVSPPFGTLMELPRGATDPADVGVVIAEDPSRGWYIEVPFVPLDGAGADDPIDLGDTAPHSPIIAIAYASGTPTGAAIGGYRDGSFVEIGYAEGDFWPGNMLSDNEIALSDAPPGSGGGEGSEDQYVPTGPCVPFWTAFHKTEEFVGCPEETAGYPLVFNSLEVANQNFDSFVWVWGSSPDPIDFGAPAGEPTYSILDPSLPVLIIPDPGYAEEYDVEATPYYPLMQAPQ